MIIKLALLYFIIASESVLGLPLGETVPRDDELEKSYRPTSMYHENNYKQYFNDEEFYLNNLVDSTSSSKGEHFLDFWLNDYSKNKDCPNQEYRGLKDYLAYTYRLLYISLLEENLEELVIYHKKMTGKGLDALTGLSTCVPKSSDMKKFLSRVKNYDPGMKLKLISKLLPSERKRLFSENDSYIINFLCPKAKSCTENFVSDELKRLINESNRLISRHCEQQEPLFNTGSNEVFFSLIYDSPALDIFESEQLKRSCLLKLRRSKSSRIAPIVEDGLLDRIIKYKEKFMYSSSKVSSPLGNIFNFGALKYFDSIGLGDFIFKEVKVAQIKKDIKVKEIVKIIKKKKVKKEIIKKIQKVEKKIKAKEKRRRRISAFERAVFAFKAKRVPIMVDMRRFEIDYPEIKKDFLKIRSSLEKFQTRKSLDIMKRVDRLGTKDQPLPLKFLKFLIDFDYHQGLYNMVTVLGDNFYLVNDIEKKKSLVKVNLRNDKETNFRWNIKVLEVN